MWKIKYYTGSEWTEKSDAVFKKIRQELNGHEECLFILPNTSSNRTFVSSDKQIRIFYGDEVVFEGLLVGAEYSEDLLVCFAYPEAYVEMDPKIIPSGSSHAVEYIGETISNVLQAICDEAGVQKGECPSGTVSVRFIRSNCLKAAQFLADAVNKDFWADWDDSLNPRFNIGTRQEHSNVSVDPLEWPKRIIDRSQKITKVIVRSVDNDGNYIEGNAGTGDKTAVFTEKGAMDVDTLNSLAQKKLDELNTESSGVTLPLKVSQGYNLYPGDTIQLDKPELGLNGTYKILTVTKRIDKVEIEIEKKVKTLDKELEDFKKYEEYGIYPIYEEQAPILDDYFNKVEDDVNDINDYVPAPPTFTAEAKEVDTSNVFRTWIETTITLVDNAGGYIIGYRKEGDSEWMHIHVAQPSSGSTITVATPDLDENANYEVHACTISKLGQFSSWSSTVTVTTKANNAAPPTPSNLSISEVLNGVILEWNAVSANDLSYYKIYYGTSNPPTNEAGESSRPFYFWKKKNNEEYTTYYFAVSAVDSAGNESSKSSSVSGEPLTVDGPDIAPNAITAEKILNGAITDVKLASGAVTLAKFASGIRPVQIVDSLPSLPNDDYPEGAVVFLTSEDKLYRSTGTEWTAVVPTSDLEGQITGEQIENGAITELKLASNAVTNEKIASDAVTSAKIADGAIVTSKIADLAITTAKLDNSAVSSDKIIDQAVTPSKILKWLAGNSGTSFPSSPEDGELFYRTDLNKVYRYDASAASWIAVDSVEDAERIEDGIITETKIADNAISTPKLQANAIVADKIASGAIVADKIGAGAVVADKIAAGAVVSDKIAANAVTSDKIAANAVIADKIAANAVDASKLTVDAIQFISSRRGLILHLPMDEGEGNVAYDFSEHENHGTINGATWTVGKFGQALSFNGQDNYVRIAGGILENESEVTFACWFKAIEQTEDYPRLFDYGWHTNAFMFCYRNTGTEYIVDFQTSDNENNQQSAHVTLEPDGKFHFAVGVWKSGEIHKLYLDGELVDTVDSPSSFSPKSANLDIGGHDTTCNYKGIIDEIRIYNRALTDEEVKSLFRLGSLINHPTVITEHYIKTGAITAEKIASGAVETNKLAAGAVTAGKIASGAVSTDQLAANAVSTDKIQAGAINASKLTVAQIFIDDLTFTDNSPSSGYVSWTSCTVYYKGESYNISSGNTNLKYIYWTEGDTSFSASDTKPAWAENRFLIALNENGIHKTVWNATIIHGGSIITGTITAQEISSGAITSEKIEAEAVIAEKIASEAVTAAKIASEAVTAEKIAASAVTADKIAAKAITTEKLTVASSVNLIPDGDFELGDRSKEWTAGTLTTDAYKGNYALRLSEMQDAYSKSYITVKPGDKYIASAYMKAHSGNTSGKVYFYIVWYNSVKDVIETSTVGSIGPGQTSYAKVESELTAPSNAYYAKVRLYSSISGGSNEYGYIDEIFLHEQSTENYIAAGAVKTKHVRFDGYENSDPSYEAGKMWWRSDKDELRFSSGTSIDEVAIIPKYPLTDNSAPPENLLPNQCFELDRDGDDVPDYWNFNVSSGSGSCSLSSTSYKGSKSLQINVNNGKAEANSILIPVVPGKKYYVSGMVKASASATLDQSPITVGCWDQNGYDDNNPSWIEIGNKSVQSDWKEFSDIIAIPSGKYYANIYCVANYSGEITLRFDDIKFSEIRSAELDKLNIFHARVFWQCSNWKNIENMGSTTGSASISYTSESLWCSTGSTYESTVTFTKYVEWGIGWSYKRILTMILKIDSNTSQVIYFGTGYFPETSVTYNGLAFKVVDGTIYAYAANSSNKTEVSLGSIDTSDQHKYTIIFYPENRAEYYIDGELKATITSNLPSGSTYFTQLFRLYLKNTAAASKSLDLFEVRGMVW